jgi:translation initiation factor IF-3
LRENGKSAGFNHVASCIAARGSRVARSSYSYLSTPRISIRSKREVVVLVVSAVCFKSLPPTSITSTMTSLRIPRLLQVLVQPRTVLSSRPRCSPSPSSLRPFSTSLPTRLPPRKAVKDGTLRDEDIPHSTVVLVDPSTGTLLPPSTVRSLLASLDRTRYAIQLANPSHDPPICRLVDKKALYDKARDKKAKDQEKAKAPTSAASQPPREVHFTWGVSAHDLEHKLKKGKEFLEKGGRILVCLADKPGTKVKVNNEVRGKVINEVQAALEGFGTLSERPKNRQGATVLEFKPDAAAAVEGKAV